MRDPILIIGLGEVGGSLRDVLAPVYGPKVFCRDKEEPKDAMKWPINFGIMHVAMNYSDGFEEAVIEYARRYDPEIISILTTTPPGTCENIEATLGIPTCHSTTRGLHPALVEGMRAIPKHVGGRDPERSLLEQHFNNAGIETVGVNSSRATELLHILNNVHYGINLMFADEAARLCREYGVDFTQYLYYTMTNNRGYIAMGHDSKVRPVLTPPNGKIGGHCVNYSANLIPEDKRPPMMDMLAHYNDKKETSK